MRSADGTLDFLQCFGVAPENILIIVLPFVNVRIARIEISKLPSFFFGRPFNSEVQRADFWR